MALHHDSILDTIGNTPCVRINRLAPDGVRLYAKLEAFNPMSSVKDRLALAIIERAERTGKLKPGQTVVEATSGNTGIGLAMVCAQKGYPLVIVMAENFSVERRRLLRFLGARVVLTPAAQRGTGMVAKAEELAERHGWFLARQFDNDANADVHSATTAQEILRAFERQGLDYFVSGYGTGGTLKGVARVLAAKSPQTKIIACEPDNSALLGSGIAQPRDDRGRRTSHPGARPHPVQGWGPDFIPRFAEETLAAAWIDEIVPVAGADALRLSRELARREGIFCGISSGATMAAALDVCRRAPKGSTILCMLPDTGERYLSTPLFDGIETEMNDTERAISASTPSCRFDGSAPPVHAKPAATTPPVAPVPAPALTEAGASEAERFVGDVLASRDRPVVMFALEWCEFCWSVRKLFAAAGIAYQSIDLDSVEYQRDAFGARIRAAVSARTGCRTIPQIFVGDRFVGGCTELMDAFADGSLHAMLAEAGVPVDKTCHIDPKAFLPNWLHSRGAA